MFLQYILQQDKESMVFKVFEATSKDPVKDDFVETCRKYMETLGIKESFKEIERERSLARLDLPILIRWMY